MTRPGSERVETDAGRAATITLVVLAIVGTAWLLLELSGFFMLVFAALVLAAVLDALTSQIGRAINLPRGFALALSVALLLGVFAGAFTLFGAQLSGEFETIRSSIPPAIAEAQALLDRAGLREPARAVLDPKQGELSKYIGQAGDYVIGVGSALANFVLVFVAAIFIASDPAVYRRGILLLMPQRAEGAAAAAIDDAARGLRGWMLGQAVSSLVVATLTWAGLAILGVPAAGGLGLIAGLLDVIPMIGPIIAGIPAVLLALTVSPTTALWTIGLFLLVQQLQGNFLQPMIQKHAVDVPPAVLLFAVVAAGLLFGFLGVLLAAPLTIVVFVIVQRVYVRTILGKDIDVAGADNQT